MSRRVPDTRGVGRWFLGEPICWTLNTHSPLISKLSKNETTSWDELEMAPRSYTPGSGVGVSPEPLAPGAPSSDPVWIKRVEAAARLSYRAET